MDPSGRRAPGCVLGSARILDRLVIFAMVSLFPRVGAVPGLAELGVESKVSALHRESTGLMWLGVALGALLFQVSPIATLGRPVLATWLEPDDLDTHAFRLATHRVYLVRQAIMLLKMMGGIFWGESPEIRTELHLPAYGRDPGTRRTEPVVVVAPVTARRPVLPLVTLGRREEERGRHVEPDRHETD